MNTNESCGWLRYRDKPDVLEEVTLSDQEIEHAGIPMQTCIVRGGKLVIYCEKHGGSKVRKFNGDKLPKTFDDWIDQAENTEEHYRRRGWQVFRAELDPEKFSAWCRRAGLGFNAAARKRFAALLARRMAQ